MSVTVTETTTTLAANTPVQIAPASPGCSVFIISNTGTGDLVFKTKSAPSAATDGTPLGAASGAGGQGGVIVLTGNDAIADAIYAWSTVGTTVNVKQGTPKP
jgi:hypothetical protein